MNLLLSSTSNTRTTVESPHTANRFGLFWWSATILWTRCPESASGADATASLAGFLMSSYRKFRAIVCLWLKVRRMKHSVWICHKSSINLLYNLQWIWKSQVRLVSCQMNSASDIADDEVVVAAALDAGRKGVMIFTDNCNIKLKVSVLGSTFLFATRDVAT